MSQKSTRHSRATTRRQCRSQDRATQRAIARKLCASAAEMSSTLDLERWASWLMGEMWLRRERVADEWTDLWPLALGAPILESVRAVGGSGARTALATIARMDRGELGSYAYDLAAELGAHDLPAHVRGVGRARVQRALGARYPGDGEALFLEVQDADACRYTVAAFVDERRGGIAKRIGLIESLDELELAERTGNLDGSWDALRLEPIGVAPACRRLRRAIAATDRAWRPPVDAGFTSYRAIAWLRACSHA